MNKESKTTTVGIATKNYVVLAADKRATAGPTVYHKNVKKIAKITDKSVLTISGLVADAQFIIENARFFAKGYETSMGKVISTRSLANYISTVLSIYLRIYPFIVQLLLGGYDHEGPGLYYIDLYGTVTREKYMATGSGSPIAFGMLEANYHDNLALEDAVDLAAKAVTAAVMRDGFTGEGVDVIAIGKDGVTLEKTIQLKKTLTY